MTCELSLVHFRKIFPFSELASTFILANQVSGFGCFLMSNLHVDGYFLGGLALYISIGLLFDDKTLGNMFAGWVYIDYSRMSRAWSP